MWVPWPLVGHAVNGYGNMVRGPMFGKCKKQFLRIDRYSPGHAFPQIRTWPTSGHGTLLISAPEKSV
jgi:hypothetical protein